MSIIEILESDWKLLNSQQDKINKSLKKHNIYFIFNQELNPSITFILFIIFAIGISATMDKYKLQVFVLWLSIFSAVLLIKILKLKVSKTVKTLTVYLSIFLSIILFFKKDEIGDFIGNNYIQGYSAWYEDSYNSQTDTEYKEHYFKTDTSLGDFTMYSFIFLYFPFLLIIPYLIWKLLNKCK